MSKRIELALEHLKAGPMRMQDFYALLRPHATRPSSGNDSQRLIKNGVIECFIDDDPEYQKGRRGTKPRCKWVRLGFVDYKSTARNGGQANAAGIAKAISYLERHGYTVTTNTKLKDAAL